MLSKVKLKKIFPGFERKWYDEVSDSGVIRSYPENELIFRPGDVLEETILVIDGLIKVYRIAPDGTEFFMYYLEPGKACALSLQCSKEFNKQQVLARTVTDALVLMIPMSKAAGWMHTFESWHQFWMQTYFNRFDELMSTIDNIAFQHMEERLEAYLEKQASLVGNTIHLTHSDIAKDLNSSREVISRLLKKLEAKGLVEAHRNHVEWIKDRQLSQAP